MESIEELDRQIQELKERRKKLVKAQQKAQRLALTDGMIEVLDIIKEKPGISNVEIYNNTLMGKRNYNNTMTSLVRRKLIVNKGTRHAPSWYRK